MKWKTLLAALSTQTKLLTLDEFKKLSKKEDLIHFPEKLMFNVSEGPLRKYLLENPSWFIQGEKTISWVREQHGRITTYGDEDYPQKFLNLVSPPLFLSYLGQSCWQDKVCLSVVGSRQPSFKSMQWMEYYLPEVLVQNVVTVSGAARGIDQKAHALSLSLELPTIAFLPSGLGAIYPSSFEAWVPEILKSGGAIVSEYAPFQGMRKHHFLERNRMIASLGESLLVVEAKRRSGSSMTARLAAEMNQNVCVLPAFPTDLNYQGNIDLIYDGAFPIRDAQDMAMLLKLNAPKISK